MTVSHISLICFLRESHGPGKHQSQDEELGDSKMMSVRRRFAGLYFHSLLTSHNSLLLSYF